MPEIIEPQTERYLSVTVEQQAKKFVYKTTVSVRTTNPNLDIQHEIEVLNNTARVEAVAEIGNRRRLDLGQDDNP